MLKQMLSTSEVRDLYSRIFSEDTGNLEIVTGDPVAAQINTVGDTDAGNTLAGGCAAGLSGLTILPDGTLVPCRRLHIPIGNIRKDSFREVWQPLKSWRPYGTGAAIKANAAIARDGLHAGAAGP